jgi:hypothetical protein
VSVRHSDLRNFLSVYKKMPMYRSDSLLAVYSLAR